MALVKRANKVGIFLFPRLVAFVVLSLVFPSSYVHSSSQDGTRVAPFLYIPAGPKQVVSPSILIGMHPDASLVFANPAPLADLPSGQIFMTSSNWLDEVTLSAVSIVVPYSPLAVKIACGAQFLYSGGLRGYSDALELVTEETYYDLALTGTLSKKLPWLNLSIGSGITYFRENLGPMYGDGLALSLGIFGRKGKNSFQLYARNIGGEISFPDEKYKIDGSMIAGYGRTIDKKWGSVELGAQVALFSSGEKQLLFGGDYIFNRFTLRVGTNHSLSGAKRSQLPVTAGMGVRYRSISLDYAFTARSYFANTHTVSISFDINSHSVDKSSLAQNAISYISNSSQPTTFGKGKEELIDSYIGRVGDIPSIKNTRETDAGQKPKFYVAAGSHLREESARAEVRALRLLDIPAVLKRMGKKFVVTVGSFKSKNEALAAIKSYKQQGHSFELLNLSD